MGSDAWDTEYRRVWRATYAAMFALITRDTAARKVIIDDDDYDAIHVAAAEIAAKAAERGSE